MCPNLQVAEDMDEAVLAQLEDAQRPSEAAATRIRCLDEEIGILLTIFFSVQGYTRMGR